MAHVSTAKKQTVQELAKLIDESPIVAVLNLENLPAKQLQVMREKLRTSVTIRMSKSRLITLAIDQSKKPDIAQIKPYLKGMPALLFSKESPFKLYKTLKKNKSKSFIKPGQTVPHDILVPKGPTGFAPGPIIGELGALKIKAGIENGKVSIKEDCIVAKTGAIADAKLASILQRLGIEPMEIGLELVAAYENGEILTKDILDVDEDAYLAMLAQAHGDAMKLALETAYTTKDTITLLIQKAFTETKTIALEQNIVSKDIINELLAKADAQANAIHSKVNA